MKSTRFGILCTITAIAFLQGARAQPNAANQARVSLQSTEPPNPRQQLESIASQLPCFDVNAVLYNRPSSTFLGGPEAEVYTKLLVKLNSLKAREDELFDLLKDNDPKVRVLAIAGLMGKNDPSVLPQIVGLATDPALSFPAIIPNSAIFPSSNIFAEKQTVGSIASAVVYFYFQFAGFDNDINDLAGHGGFAQYWQERKDRKYCASWFAVQLMRATRGTQPLQNQYSDDIRQVRARVDEMPGEDRAWALLWLRNVCPQGSVEKSVANAFVTEEELVKAAQFLGAEKLMRALQRRIPSNDPDLQPRPSNNWNYRQLTLFVLQHARVLLRPGDADVLLAQNLWEKDNVYHKIMDPTITPWWAIAAAQLQPAKAEDILHDQYPIFQDKYSEDALAQLGVALWQQVGESQAEFLTNWYYDELLKTQPQAYVDWRNTFIDGIAQTDHPTGKKLIATILASPRFEQIDWESAEHFAKAINGWLPQPLFSREELNTIDRGKSPELEAKLVDRLRISVSLWRQ